MNQNEDFISTNNATSINIDYSDYSNNKLPLWAKKGLKINCPNDESSTNLVANRLATSTPVCSNRTRISVYNRSTDSDERNSVEDGQQNEFESPIERLKKKAQQLSTSHSTNREENTGIKMNGGDHNEDLSSLNKKKNPLYVSTENLKYNENFFTKTPLPKTTNSSTHLTSTLNKPSPGQRPSVLTINSSTPKSTNQSTNQLHSNISLNSSSLNNSLNSSATNNTLNRSAVITKRREELAKALAEARSKLQNLTDINRKPTGGLSTSMSVANINRLSSLSSQPLKENNSLLVTAPIQKSNLSNSINQSQSYESDAVRRSISLSDLSHSQMLANRSLTLKQQQQIRSKLSPAANNVYYPLRNLKKNDHQSPQHQAPPPQQFDPPQGLWGKQQQQQQQQHMNNAYPHERLLNSSLNNTSQNSINQLHHQNGSITPTHKPIRIRMSRSSSMASINKSDSLRTLENSSKPQGLWNSSLSINTLRSNSSAQNNSHNVNKFNHHNNKLHHRKASSDDESSSDENDLYHRISQRPSTPPKPTLRQLRRSSTTTNNLFMPTNNAHNNSANLTLQQNNSSGTVKSSTHKTSPNRKSWSNNFELRPAKSEYNLNSMGQETVNSPSSGFWSNQSNSGGNGHLNNGTMTNGNVKMSKANAIGYENFDLTNINPQTVPLTSELFQHIVDELNHLGTFAKKIHYRAQAEENDKLCNLLKEGVSKVYVNLQTIVPLSSNNVLPITKSISKETSFNHHHHNLNKLTNNKLSNGHHQDSSNTDHDTEEDNLSSPLNNNAAVSHVSLTSDSASSSLPQESLAMNLLQHYSERLLSMVEGQIRNKDK